MNSFATGLLEELVLPVESWNPLRAAPGDVFTYIDLSAVDQDTKEIVAARQLPCVDAPSRARQRVAAGDVLVSTVRPNLNGVARVASHLNGATASTGFCVLRPRPEKLDGNYLFHWVKSARFVSDMVRKATGASYPAVSDRIVGESLIPLAPLQDQRRIAAILDQAETLRAQRRAAIAQLDSLGQAIFLEMFGDPTTNSLSLPMTSLEALGEWKSGGTPSRSKSEYFEGTVPWFSSGELESMYVTRSAEHVSEAAIAETSVKRVRTGSLMLGMYDTAALKASIAGVECSCNQAIAFARMNPSVAHVLYVYFAIVIGRDHFRRLQRGVRQKNLNLSMIRELRIPLPPVVSQQEFAARVDAIERLKASHRAALSRLDDLFASLQHRAFRGELTKGQTSNLEELRKLEADVGLEALIFVAKRTEGHDLYTAQKALYLADKRHLERHGRLIYGETYSALPMGPVPEAAYNTVKFLRHEQMFCAFGESAAAAALRVEGNRLIPLRDADLGKLGAEAAQSLEWAIRYFAGARFEQVKTATHDAAYERTPRNAAIALEDLIDTLPVEARRRLWPDL